LQDRSVFLELKLRQEPLVAEDLAYEERRALLDEAVRGKYDPRRVLRTHEEPETPERGQREPAVIIAENAEDAIQKSPTGRLVFLGNPGAGKTILLRHLIIEFARQAKANTSYKIPI